MRVEQAEYIDGSWNIRKKSIFANSDIVFTFGSRDAIKDDEIYKKLKKIYPSSDIVGCSSGGNIIGDSISKAKIVATAVDFYKGSIRVATKDFSPIDNQVEVSRKLLSLLPKENLKHIFLLSDGLTMNGSALVKGANEAVKNRIPITGGLAGDDLDFTKSVVRVNSIAKSNRVVAVGFYGDSLTIESGCYSGWKEFGILRKITKSIDNIVYEIDNRPALELYKKYLGEHAKYLPKSALNFPISIKAPNSDNIIIRSVLGVDEHSNALIFAGDVPEGSIGRLMKSSVDNLIDGALVASTQIRKINYHTALALVVSCIGRRVVLNQLTEEELEIISDNLGENIELSGFYSYGEIAPFSDNSLSCNLHNQTMTITVIYED